MKKTAPTEVGGCMAKGGREAILEILDGSLMPLKSRKINRVEHHGFIVKCDYGVCGLKYLIHLDLFLLTSGLARSILPQLKHFH